MCVCVCERVMKINVGGGAGSDSSTLLIFGVLCMLLNSVVVSIVRNLYFGCVFRNGKCNVKTICFSEDREKDKIINY